MLLLEGVRKRFGREPLLEGISLRVAPGERLGLLGPNGSGKTTTLRIAAGLIAPDAGRAAIGEEGVSPLAPAARRRIGYLPERTPLYDPLTVEEYLHYVARAKGLDAAARARDVERAIETWGLAPVRRKLNGRLSKGFRQRVGLAQAALGDPDLLLLDEPTNGLDVLQLVEVRAILRADSPRRAMVISTHLMHEVEALCTRAAVLHAGRLIELGPVAPGGPGLEQRFLHAVRAS